MERRSAFFLSIAAAALLCAPPVEAQAVSARILEAGTAQPVVGAVVYLVGGAGAAVRRGLTDRRGRALLLDVPPGRYRLRAEMIGMETLESEAFEVAPGATVQQELRLEARPIDVEGVAVEVGERCRVRPAEGLAVQRVWEEARKALEATTLTDDRRAYRYRTMIYERDLDTDARTVLGEERSHRRATLRTPFRSRPAEELVEQGFVESSDEGDLYFAPDAEVLLSDVFLDSHCFRLVRPEAEDRAGLVGLAFEPLELEGRRVDVSGTLWLDPATSRLRWLDYRYENLHPEIRSDEIGGRVEFRRMPDGGWIVPEWYIRMPSLAVQRDVRGRRRIFVAGFRQTGGLVLDVEGVGGAEPATGAIEGVVLDSLGRALQGVRVELVGTGRQARTGPGGRYRIDDLVKGTYRVRFEDEKLKAYGHEAEPLDRTVTGGGTARADFRMPSAASVLAEACRSEDPGPEAEELPIQAIGTGTLVGWVRDAETGEPLPGAVVRVLSYRHEFARGTQAPGSLPIYSGASVGQLPGHETRLTVHRGMYGLETTADEEGFYRVCRLPERELLTVIGLHDGVETRGDTLKIMETGGAREHLVRVPRKRR